MKKIFTLSLSLVLALGASANVKPGTMAAKRSMPLASIGELSKANKKELFSGEKLSKPVNASDSRLKGISLKYEEGDGPYFEKPLGTYFVGYSKDFYGFSTSYFLYGPAYCDLSFNSIAPEGFEWTYVDPTNPDDGTNENFLTSNDAVLNLNYGNIFWASAPTLTSGDATFKAAQYLFQGGGAEYTDPNDGTIFHCSNRNPEWKMAYNTTYVGLNYDESAAWYKEGLGVDAARVKGWGEYLPYAGVPYLLRSVYMPCAPEQDSELTLYIYKAVANEDGTFKEVTDELLTTATTSVVYEEDSYSMAIFDDLLYMDPETGGEETLLVDCPIVAVVVSDNKIGPTFAVHTYEHELDNHALQYVEFDYQGETYSDFFDANGSWTSGYQSSWVFMYDIDFFYLHNNEDTDTFNAPAEGGEKTFKMDSYISSPGWDITTPEYDNLPDWITVEAEDEYTYDESGEPTGYTGVTNVKVTVAALPEGVESRTQDILLSYEGAQCILHVVQPEGAGPEPQPVPGDVNGDGEVTGSDVTALYNHILFGQDTEIFNGDQNGDGEVTGSDVTAVYNIILGL